MISLALSSTSIAALMVGSSSFAAFALWRWFLKTNSWDTTGEWEDGVLWVQEWFLMSGSINVFDSWVDAASWVQNWFLATGILNVFGVWADSEAWT